jgi:hypothetical protein
LVGADIRWSLQAQQNGHIVGGVGVDQTLVDDAERFLEASTVAECLPASQSPTGEVAALQKTDKQTYVVEDVECNAYCTEWSRHMLDLGHKSEPWRLRRVLEAFKLKVCTSSVATALSSHPKLRLLISAVLGSTTVGGIRL